MGVCLGGPLYTTPPEPEDLLLHVDASHGSGVSNQEEEGRGELEQAFSMWLMISVDVVFEAF